MPGPTNVDFSCSGFWGLSGPGLPGRLVPPFLQPLVCRVAPEDLSLAGPALLLLCSLAPGHCPLVEEQLGAAWACGIPLSCPLASLSHLLSFLLLSPSLIQEALGPPDSVCVHLSGCSSRGYCVATMYQALVAGIELIGPQPTCLSLGFLILQVAGVCRIQRDRNPQEVPAQFLRPLGLSCTHRGGTQLSQAFPGLCTGGGSGDPPARFARD